MKPSGNKRQADLHFSHFVLMGVLLLLLTPADALAWGPATHIGVGEAALGQLVLLPGAIGALLARHRLAFLYGNIVADIVFAKRMSRVKQFCHHWSTGFRILEQAELAENEATEAMAYGYLAHLAADTVAHGKYVPRQLSVSGTSQNLGHFFWELRAEGAIPGEQWSTLRELLARDRAIFHTFLAPHLSPALLSFPVNRVLFERMNALSSAPIFLRSVGMYNRRSRWELPTGLLDGYMDESVDRVVSILSDGDKSALLREDPNGTSALMQARVIRRDVRRRRRRGHPVAHRIREASQSFSPVPRPIVLTDQPAHCGTDE